MTAPYPVPSYDPTDAGNRPDDGPLRIGAVPLTGFPGKGGDLPSALSPAAEAQMEDLGIARDLFGGPGRVRRKTTKYLPKAPAEDQQNYNVRLQRSVFFNFFGKTIKGLCGFIFRKDPDIGDDVPPQIKEHCENIDLAGTHVDVFLYEMLQDGMTAGHSAILVDYPNTGGRPMTLLDEQGLRPYWVPIKKDNILSWRTVIEDGRTILSQIVLLEMTYVPDGPFGEKEQKRYRMLWRVNTGKAIVVGFQLLEINEKNVVVEVDAGLYKNQVEIPIAEVPTSGRRGMFESDPPLVDLAFLNVAHYQQWSDYATSMHMTCVPILFTAGFDLEDDDGEDIIVGANMALNSENPAGKAEYVSHNGAALGQCKLALDDLKNDMASLGIAMLSNQKRVAETAEAKRIGKSDTDSALSVTARGLQDGVERALGFHAKYMGLDSGGSIKINRDFENLQMQSDMLIAFVQAVKDAGLPPMLFLEQMQEGGLIAPDKDLDEVLAEMMANAQAIADQKAADAAAQQQDKAGGGGAPPDNTGGAA